MSSTTACCARSRTWSSSWPGGRETWWWRRRGAANLAPRRRIRQKLESDSPGLGGVENSEVGRAQHCVVLSLPNEVHLFRSLQRRAPGEVVGVAVQVFSQYRRKEAVLFREVDEARVGIADHEDARRAVGLATAIELAQKGRVGRPVFLTDRAVRCESAKDRQLIV